MAVRVATKIAKDWFTPEDQKNDPEPTRYLLEPLDGVQFMNVAAHGEINAEGFFTPNQTGRLMLVKMGLVGWEHFYDRDSGDELEFRPNRIKFVPGDHLIEIANEILSRAALEAAEAKNLQSPSQ